MDINLPDMSGREVTTMLRREKRFSTIPIVALTAMTMGEQRELAMAAGLTGYMTKPVDMDGLLERVDDYLKGAQEVLDPQALSDAQTRYSQELVARLEERIRDLENANRSLARLDTMKDTFIQLTAHELRTPLTLVYGYSRLLEENAELEELGQIRRQPAHADGGHVQRDHADAGDHQRDSARQPHHDQPASTCRSDRPTWATSRAR